MKRPDAGRISCATWSGACSATSWWPETASTRFGSLRDSASRSARLTPLSGRCNIWWHQLMADADAVDSAKLSRYDALLRISKTLSGHKTMAELFEVLADQLHTIVPFDYLALLLHDQPASEMRLVVLEPIDIMPPFTSVPLADQGPAAVVWE